MKILVIGETVDTHAKKIALLALTKSNDKIEYLNDYTSQQLDLLCNNKIQEYDTVFLLSVNKDGKPIPQTIKSSAPHILLVSFDKNKTTPKADIQVSLQISNTGCISYLAVSDKNNKTLFAGKNIRAGAHVIYNKLKMLYQQTHLGNHCHTILPQDDNTQQYISEDKKQIFLPVPLESDLYEINLCCEDQCIHYKKEFDKHFPPIPEGRCAYNMPCHTKLHHIDSYKLTLNNIGHVLKNWNKTIFATKESAEFAGISRINTNKQRLKRLGITQNNEK